MVEEWRRRKKKFFMRTLHPATLTRNCIFMSTKARRSFLPPHSEKRSCQDNEALSRRAQDKDGANPSPPTPEKRTEKKVFRTMRNGEINSTRHFQFSLVHGESRGRRSPLSLSHSLSLAFHHHHHTIRP